MVFEVGKNIEKFVEYVLSFGGFVCKKLVLLREDLYRFVDV